jgi:hypothetical protein
VTHSSDQDDAFAAFERRRQEANARIEHENDTERRFQRRAQQWDAEHPRRARVRKTAWWILNIITCAVFLPLGIAGFFSPATPPFILHYSLIAGLLGTGGNALGHIIARDAGRNIYRKRIDLRNLD